jgi:hypothetical protein
LAEQVPHCKFHVTEVQIMTTSEPKGDHNCTVVLSRLLKHELESLHILEEKR